VEANRPESLKEATREWIPISTIDRFNLEINDVSSRHNQSSSFLDPLIIEER